MFAFSQVFVLVAENRKSIVIGEESMRRQRFPEVEGDQVHRFGDYPLLLHRNDCRNHPGGRHDGRRGHQLQHGPSSDKDPSSFGKGNPKGLATVSAANNAVVGGSLIR
jgi:hypothetical protein